MTPHSDISNRTAWIGVPWCSRQSVKHRGSHRTEHTATLIRRRNLGWLFSYLSQSVGVLRLSHVSTTFQLVLKEGGIYNAHFRFASDHLDFPFEKCLWYCGSAGPAFGLRTGPLLQFISRSIHRKEDLICKGHHFRSIQGTVKINSECPRVLVGPGLPIRSPAPWREPPPAQGLPSGPAPWRAATVAGGSCGGCFRSWKLNNTRKRGSCGLGHLYTPV